MRTSLIVKLTLSFIVSLGFAFLQKSFANVTAGAEVLIIGAFDAPVIEFASFVSPAAQKAFEALVSGEHKEGTGLDTLKHGPHFPVQLLDSIPVFQTFSIRRVADYTGIGRADA